MATTAKTIRINRATGDALAEGDVKSTYSELKEQPNGALLASSSPIHVTAHSMTAHNTPGMALYSGNARLWQDANMIEAPTIQFDRDRRFVTAQGTPAQPVQTILVQNRQGQGQNKRRRESRGTSSRERSRGKPHSPGWIQPHLHHRREAHVCRFRAQSPLRRRSRRQGRRLHGVRQDAPTPTCYPAVKPSNHQSFAGPGQLDHMVAEGDVVIQQPNRRAEGQKLVYTAADDKFVLTGGPPSIFDAEQGKITGVSLTFFRRDDRVLVEGEASTPVVTQTRVAR